VVVLGRGGDTSADRSLVSVWPDAPREDVPAERAAPLQLAEPCDRGTAATALRALHWIHWRDPAAVVALRLGGTPVDRREDELRAPLAAAAAFVHKHAHWSVVLAGGAAQGQAGWIEPGDPLGLAGSRLLRRVRRLGRDGPRTDRGSEAVGAVVTRASTLVELGKRHLPEMSDALAHAARFAGAVDDSWLLRRAYVSTGPCDLLLDLLPHALPRVALLRLGDGASPSS
jgi:hypothetical protein